MVDLHHNVKQMMAIPFDADTKDDYEFSLKRWKVPNCHDCGRIDQFCLQKFTNSPLDSTCSLCTCRLRKQRSRA